MAARVGVGAGVAVGVSVGAGVSVGVEVGDGVAVGSAPVTASVGVGVWVGDGVGVAGLQANAAASAANPKSGVHLFKRTLSHALPRSQRAARYPIPSLPSSMPPK